MTRLDLVRTRPWLASISLIGALSTGCQLPLDHAACPCADGWVCCPAANVCVSGGEACPGGAGGDAGSDAPGAGDDPIAELQRLQVEHGWSGDDLGFGVALAGDLAVAGVPGRDGDLPGQGMVVVYERRGDALWVRDAVLASPAPASEGHFGSAVALVGSQRVLVGAPDEAGGAGRVYLFQRSADGWSLQQTIEPDLGSVPADQVAMLRFGSSVAADGARAVISAAVGPELFDVSATGAAQRAQLELPIAGPVGMVVGEASVLVWGLSDPSGSVYVYDDTLGWTGPSVVTQAGQAPGPLAYDGQRLALASGQAMRVLDRSGGGWTAPVDVVLPAEVAAHGVHDLAWRGDELAYVSEISASMVGLGRVRSIGGTWQADPLLEIDQRGGLSSRITASGDRVMVGLPFANLDGTLVGNAMLYGVDDTGFTADSTLGFDEAPLATEGWIASTGGALIASPAAGDHSTWFARDPDGVYRRRPSLVVAGGARIAIAAAPAISGRHALVAAVAPGGFGPTMVQSFELGDHDWTAGATLTAPDSDITSFGTSVAVDGDTAVVGGVRTSALGGGLQPPRGVAVVHAWTGGAWTVSATVDLALECAQLALAGNRLAAFCGSTVHLFERDGQTWYQMPAPSVAATDPTGEIQRLVLAGDLLGIASTARGGDPVVIDVFRWTDGHWQDELHLGADQAAPGCLSPCRFGIAALGADRVVLFRDATSVAPYRWADGAWLAGAPIALPAAPRSPDALIAGAVVGDGELALWVPREGDGLSPLAGAIHVFRWP